MLREFLLCSKMSQLYVFIYPIHTYRSRQHWVHFPVLSCRSLLVIDFIHTTGYKILGHSRTHPNCPGQIENSTCVCVCVRAKSLQSCLTFCDPMDRSPPGSSVHGILQARILEWVAISFSRGSSWLRDWTWGSYMPCIAGGFLPLNHLKPENSMLS